MCVLSSHIERYAGELRAIPCAVIYVLIEIRTPSHPPGYFYTCPVSMKNHNLIKEFPKVKDEEEGESGFSFLSQWSV